MATYVNDLRLKEIATGDESGTWGTSTNTNLELIAEAFSYGTEDFASDADDTFTIADGSTDPARSLYLKVGTSTTLTATRTLTLAPNTVSKVWIIENATAGSQSITISQGSGSTVTIPNGDVKVVYTDGAGATAAVTDAFANLKVTDPAQTNITSVGTLTSLTVSGDLTVDTNTLYVDSTNNRVGIGTTSPTTKLNVVESSAATAATFKVGDNTAQVANVVVSNDADTGLNLGVFGSSAGTAGMISASDAFITTSTTELNVGVNNGSGVIKFGVGSTATEKMRIDGTGVGIGTSSPSTNLHISGAANNTYLRIDDGTEFLNLGVDGTGIFYNSNTTHRFLTNSGGTECLRILSTGEVGIGTSSPSNTLTLSSGTNDGRQLKLYGTSNNALIKFDNFDTAQEYSMGLNGSAFIVYDDTNSAYRLTLSSSGNFGIGTSSPAQKFTVYGSDNNNLIMSSNSGGNSNTMRIQANDAASYIVSSAAVPLIVDVQSAEAMRINSNGHLLVNTTTDYGQFVVETNVAGSNPIGCYIYSTDTVVDAGNVLGRFSYESDATLANGSYFLQFNDAAGTIGSITSTASSSQVAFNTSSDERLKENIIDAGSQLDIIKQVQVREFDWKKNGNHQVGMIAQELNNVIPEVVTVGGESEFENPWSIDYGKLTPHLIKAIQEQQVLIEQLQAEVALLKGE